MENTILPFDELMKAVLEQLESQKYMDSTLTVYRRTYNRIHIFLNHHGTDIYTHELGKAFLADSNVSKLTFASYACAVRRLDDYIDGKPYRCHHGNYNEQIPWVFADTLTGYLQECINNGNKPATVCSKERTCISFLNFVENAGCFDLSQLNTGIVSQALLTFSNKDAYARIRQFLNYLAEKGIIEMDLSRIVPHYKRGRCFLRHIRQMKSAGSKLLLIPILLSERETLLLSDWHHEWDSVQVTLQNLNYLKSTLVRDTLV